MSGYVGIALILCGIGLQWAGAIQMVRANKRGAVPAPAVDARAERLDAESRAMPKDFTSMRFTARGPDGQDHVICAEFDAEGRLWVKAPKVNGQK